MKSTPNTTPARRAPHARRAAVAILAQLLLAGAAHAVPVIDGGNALIFGNYKSTNGSTEGALLVGGNTTLNGYSVNTQSSNPYGLISGGTVNLVNTGITGSLWSGGAVTQSGSGASGGMNSLSASDVPWSLYRSYYDDLSNDYSALANTGTTNVQWGTMTLTATNSAPTAVFTLTAEQLRNTYSMTFAGLTAGQDLVLNILGSSVSFANMDLSTSLGAYSAILNFIDATSVTFNNIEVSAAVLATDAKITGRNGAVTGLVVANEWDAQIALKYNAETQMRLKSEADMRAALSGPVNHVPEPGALALVGAAILGLGITRRRQVNAPGLLKVLAGFLRRRGAPAAAPRAA